MEFQFGKPQGGVDEDFYFLQYHEGRDKVEHEFSMTPEYAQKLEKFGFQKASHVRGATLEKGVVTKGTPFFLLSTEGRYDRELQSRERDLLCLVSGKESLYSMAATAHTSFSELMKTGVTVYVDYKPELKSYIHGSPYFQEQELYTWVISDGTEGYVLVCTPDEYISISSQL